MKAKSDIRNVKLYLWTTLAFFLLLTIHLISSYPDSWVPRVVNNAWRLPYVLVLNYLLFEFAIPLILRKRSYVLKNILVGLPVIFIFMMFYSWGLYAWRLVGIGIGVYTSLFKINEGSKIVTEQMSFSMSSVFFFGIVRHIYMYVKLKQSAQQLRIEKQQAELGYLKSQTNPHFLFNTLNNIYSLARTKSDLAPESILRLSKILRFMLYETSGDFISVEQELKIVSDYLELEKLRYDESLSVNFNYDVEDKKQAVPPLLLIPLVENAFKHGVSETTSRPFVDIHLSIRNRQLKFVVRNSASGTDEAAVKENIGLSNLRRQLQLLYTGYELNVTKSAHEFTAVLMINLGTHVENKMHHSRG